ncbi:NAD(P)-dependent alcohol dehydrogenase [Planctomycetota bacterium]|nr:NAD(P)-dependent alcohol dehydrogenase [Planctomycetota bacterium]
MQEYNAYAAYEQGAALKPFSYDPGSLGPDDVEIKVTHCGLCHSDLAMIDNDWGNAKYPLVPGHEVIGIVTQMGPDVDNLDYGDVVGLGWQCGSCMDCEWCEFGDHNLCSDAEDTIVGHHGGFADYVRTHKRFAIRVPKQLKPVNAAPLLCAGITVFNPFVQNNITAMDRVGVVGIGGLGHIALQFAHAFGCHTTAFSSNLSKETEAKSLGAVEFVNTSDEHQLKQATRSCDFIIVTANADLPWSEYVRLLRPKGNMCFVGIPPSPITLHAFDLIVGQKAVSGSPIGSPTTIERMFDFAALNHIKAVTETFAFEDVNQAINKLKSGQVRYRAVLTNEK